jgi:hypothetical protein
MGSWVDMGHAMRRRIGAPSNHFEAAGPTEGRTHATSEEHYQMATNQNSPRVSVGDNIMDGADEAMSPAQDMAKRGTMVPKKSTQSVDPTAGGKANRTNILQERLGASYRVSVPYTPTVDPTAGPTMANARTIPSVQGRQNPHFMDAVNDQY